MISQLSCVILNVMYITTTRKAIPLRGEVHSVHNQAAWNGGIRDIGVIVSGVLNLSTGWK
jgi:hypothetical protein